MQFFFTEIMSIRVKSSEVRMNAVEKYSQEVCAEQAKK